MSYDQQTSNVPRFYIVSFHPKVEKEMSDEIRINVQVVIDFALNHLMLFQTIFQCTSSHIQITCSF